MNEEIQQTAPAEEIAIETPQVETPETPQEQPAGAQEAPSRRDSLAKALEAVDKAESEPKEPTAQERGPDGKFVAKDRAPETTTEKPAEPEKKAEAEAKDTPRSDAPVRFSPDAKTAWKDAPAAVQGEVKRALAELEKGIQQKDQVLAPLKPFLDMATQHNVKLDQVINNYVQTEQLLMKSPREGFERIARNMGKTLPDLLAEVTGAPSTATAADREISALNQKIAQLESQIGSVNNTLTTSKMETVTSQVAEFAEKNERFDELSGEIAKLLETGYASSLAQAYELAERLNPLPVAPATPLATAQTRAPQSVIGSPASGSNPAAMQPSKTRKEALERAAERMGL